METKAPERPTDTRLAPAEVVRAAFAAYNRGALDESRRYLAPDLEWVLPSAGLYGDVLRGPDALVRVLRSEFEAFSQIRREPLELEEDGDRVVGVVAEHARGRASGVELGQHILHSFVVRDGLIVRAEMSNTPHPGGLPRTTSQRGASVL
jgi:ketosteroid isomerase-like protein